MNLYCLKRQIFKHYCDEIILVFLNFKGLGQVIRLLLTYLQLPFTDVYLDQYETQKPTLSEKVRKIIEAHLLTLADVPTLIHDGEVISEVNQIVTYVCRAFDREDLLGSTLQQQTQVCEVMEIYVQRIVPSIFFLRGYVVEAFNSGLEGVGLLAFIERKYIQLLEESGYILELSVYLMKQEQQAFVFGNLTVIDFIFYEGARHALSLFAAIDEESASSRWTETAKAYKELKESKGQNIQKVEVLRAIKKYLQFFDAQPFYQQRAAYFEGFKVFPKQIPETILMGLKKLWAIDEKYLHY